MLVLMVPLALVYVTPTLWKQPTTPRRAPCAANLRAIAQAARIYANDHHGELPPDLETLLQGGKCRPTHFLCPPSGSVPPACDFYYVPEVTSDDPPDWIVAYADPAYRNGIGANILYLDGHVVFVMEPEFSQRLQRFKVAYEQDRGEPPKVIPPH